MKVLLIALALLFFFDSVFSLGDIFTCPTFGSCPKGYTPKYSGSSMNNAVCQCKKDDAQTIPRCSSAKLSCKIGSSKEDLGKACFGLELDCTPREIIDFCNNGFNTHPEICDRANQKLRKEKNAKTQQDCEFYKKQCTYHILDSCESAAETCDPDTTIQLCKNNIITAYGICEEAEIQKEKERAEDTKYSCDYSQKLCLENIYSNVCSEIPKFCDAETAAKWCYKDDTKQIEKISDADCSRVVKKSQYLMFGQSKRECWEQVPLCEGGNSEACALVATFCVKDVVSALCHAKKIKNERICKYAGLEETTSSGYPGCKFFADKCRNWQLCDLAFRYCDKDTVAALCDAHRIRSSLCRGDLSIPVADFLTVSNGIPVIITSVLGLGF